MESGDWGVESGELGIGVGSSDRDSVGVGSWEWRVENEEWREGSVNRVEWGIGSSRELRIRREWRVGSSELGLELMATGKRTFERRCST